MTRLIGPFALILCAVLSSCGPAPDRKSKSNAGVVAQHVEMDPSIYVPLSPINCFLSGLVTDYLVKGGRAVVQKRTVAKVYCHLGPTKESKKIPGVGDYELALASHDVTAGVLATKEFGQILWWDKDPKVKARIQFGYKAKLQKMLASK